MKNNQYLVYKANIDKLIESYPFIFNKKAPKPLSIGFYQQLAMDGATELKNTVLRSVLMIWTNRFEYLREVIKHDAKRYNLDGSVQGEVSSEHRTAAIIRQRRNRSASKMARMKRIQLEEERMDGIGVIDKKELRCLLSSIKHG